MTDKSGASDTEILNIFVKNNSYPYFNQSISNFTISEDDSFTLQVNATDPDPGDNVSYSDNSNFFEISQSGQISFTSNCSLVNNHNIGVTVTDPYGAAVTEYFSLNIIFEPDSPEFTNFSEQAYEGLSLTIHIRDNYVYDEDLDSDTTENRTIITGCPIILRLPAGKISMSRPMLVHRDYT